MPYTPFAQYMAAVGPAGTAFAPSREGRRHRKEYFVPMEDIEHGATTLRFSFRPAPPVCSTEQ